MSFFGENFSRFAGARFSTSRTSGNSSAWISRGEFVRDERTRIKINVRIASASSPKFARRIAESHRVKYAAEESAGGSGGLASSTGDVEMLPARDPDRAEVRIWAPRSAALRCWYAVS